MVLRPEVGETLEKFIRVINDNPEPITITFAISGDLKDNVKLEEESFVLAPGEEKNAYFTIFADSPSKTETKINVVFTPEEGNGVGLTSTILIIPNDGKSLDDKDINVKELSDEDSSNEEDRGISFKPSASKALENQKQKSIEISPSKVLLISTLALTIIIIILFFYFLRKTSNKTKYGKRLTRRRA